MLELVRTSRFGITCHRVDSLRLVLIKSQQRKYCIATSYLLALLICFFHGRKYGTFQSNKRYVFLFGKYVAIFFLPPLLCNKKRCIFPLHVCFVMEVMRKALNTLVGIVALCRLLYVMLLLCLANLTISKIIRYTTGGRTASLLSSAESGLLAVLVWSCWKERNRRVWNGDFMEPTRVGLLASTSYSFYLQAQPVKLPKRLRLKQVWQRPRSEWIKVNCDRAMDWNTKEGAASYVCRDESGLVVSGGCHYLTVAASPALMEAEALRMACMHAKAREWQKVEFEVDCLGLVNVINSEEDDDAVIGQVIEDIKVLLHSFDNFLIIHVYREANCAAHRLARFSLCSRVSASWVGILPNHIQGHALEFCI